MTLPHSIARAGAALSLPLLAVVLTACAPTAQQPPAEPPATFEEYQLALVDCLREQGIDIDDPDADGLQVGGDSGALAAAAEACQEELGMPPAPEEGEMLTDTELLERDIEIAECFRENGVDVADPQLGTGLDIPAEVPVDVFELCAPQGIMGSTGAGSR